jgi:hypothetical protein
MLLLLSTVRPAPGDTRRGEVWSLPELEKSREHLERERIFALRTTEQLFLFFFLSFYSWLQSNGEQ